MKVHNGIRRDLKNFEKVEYFWEKSGHFGGGFGSEFHQKIGSHCYSFIQHEKKNKFFFSKWVV